MTYTTKKAIFISFKIGMYIRKVTNSRKNLKFSKTLLGQNGVMLDISYDVMNQRKYILLYYTVLEIWGSGARV